MKKENFVSLLNHKNIKLVGLVIAIILNGRMFKEFVRNGKRKFPVMEDIHREDIRSSELNQYCQKANYICHLY